MTRTDSFNPVDYGFKWIEQIIRANDGVDYGWYEFNSLDAHELAKQKRDERAKELKSSGHKIVKHTLKNQLITRGGIGSGHPEISVIVTVYEVSYDESQDANAKLSQTAGYFSMILGD